MPDNARPSSTVALLEYCQMERLFARGIGHVRPPEARRQIIAMLADWLEEHYPEFDEATWYGACEVRS